MIRPPEEEIPKLTLLEKYDTTAYALLRPIADRLAEAFEFPKSIRAAGMHVSPPVYISRVLFTTLIVGFIVVGSIFGLFFATLPLLLKLLISLVILILPMITLAIGFMYPLMLASSRARSLDHELPFVAAYMTAMARGGVPPERVFEKLTTSELFPAMKREAKLVLRDVKLFGKDFLTALENHAIDHPNRHYKDFVLGYVSTIRVGGDVLNYLESKTQSLFEVRASTVKVIADRMSMLTELYITLAVIMALSFYVFFSVSNIISPGGGYSSLTNFILFAFVALPSISILMLGLIHASQPKTPIKLEMPYRHFYMSLPLGVVVFLATLYFTGALPDVLSSQITLRTIHNVNFALAIFLVLVSVPPALSFSLESERLRGYERHVASFLRDLSEVRKTGLSPEKCIVYVSKREYGPLTPVVKGLAKQIDWGFPLKKSLTKAMGKVKNWFTQAILGFMVDAIEVGGGSVATLETLTRFTTFLSELEIELKSKLRIYLMMPYFGALLTATATLLVINFILSTLQAATISQAQPPVPIEVVILLFTVSIIVNSWLMGIVAGKISTTYTAGGFSHSILLAVTTYAATELVLVLVVGPTLATPI